MKTSYIVDADENVEVEIGVDTVVLRYDAISRDELDVEVSKV